ncbi:MAG: serine-type D-Ala-D-Ala carboxypeptidase [Gammaproteobacteria bacterium]|nr:serine-type D-Ala-D-Ala carboxypeptidase [Gammaproteobacteria bacterium]|tara:strand:- start:656 stop:1792 length:1137 start_codon:yes stop_codon:yes gene_type:complete
MWTTMKILIVNLVLVFTITQAHTAPIPKPPNPNVKSYVLMDYDSGMIIASKNPELVLPPASITKIMTSYIAFLELDNDTLSMNDVVTVSKKAWKTGGSKMFIEVGKKIKVSDLLQGIITSSGNDASVALSEHISGDEETFSIYMNQVAANMGLKNTNYVNSTGLPNDKLYTSAEDIAVLSRNLIRDFPKMYKLYSRTEYVFNDIKQYSRNKLLYVDDSVDGIKTGFTKKAGYCLVSSAKRGNRRLIAVVMGAKSPDQRTTVSKSLLEYGFRFYETHKIYEIEDIVTKARIFDGEKREIELGVSESAYISIPRRSIKKIKSRFVVDENLTAPIQKGENVGYISVELADKVITKINLYTREDVKLGSAYRRTLDSILKNF